MAIEPLAEAVRRDTLMAGLDVGEKSHKITLYADDVLLFMLNPSVSVTRLIQIIARFAAFSGYKFNFSKSDCLLVICDNSQLTRILSHSSGPLQVLYI